jgi:hypothetical protein
VAFMDGFKTDRSFGVFSGVSASCARHPSLTIASLPARFPVTTFRSEQNVAPRKNLSDGGQLV